MITRRGLTLAAAAVLSLAGSAVGQKPTEASVAEFHDPSKPTCGIQEAIDSLPPGGGAVYIPPGRYVLRCAIVLRDHVTLRGAGSATILTRAAEAHAKLTRPARKGQSHVEVESTKGFRAGDEVALMDDRMHGWYMAHCVVKDVAAKRLTFAEPIASGHKEGVFEPKRRAVVVNYFPFICGSRVPRGKPIRDVTVRDLAIDGNLKANPGRWKDFTLAAVHFAQVSDALVRGVRVHGHIGDGIGVQGGRDVRVESCFVERCRGHGLHPGTALQGAVFANNISRDNDGDGLFFCWEVLGITVSGNLLHGNCLSGIGGLGAGGKKGDRFNVVTGNVCRANGRWGIHAVGGKNNVITGNVCVDNSRSKPGGYSGIGLQDTTHTLVSGNRCGCEGKEATQRFGIEERGRSDENVVSGNLCASNKSGGVRVVGKATVVGANLGGVTRAAASE